MKKAVLYILFTSAFSFSLQAAGLNENDNQTPSIVEKYRQHKDSKVYEFSVKAAFNLGGTAPMGLPAEIRHINAFSPTLALSIGGDVTRWFSHRWGASAGLRFESKGMDTDASVENYVIKLLSDGSYVEGNYWGNVTTKVDNQYLTIPIQAVYKVSSRWILRGGPYVSFLLRGSFTGDAYGTSNDNGYMRTSPTEPKIKTDAPYDFSDDIRRFDCGVDAGAEFAVYKHLSIYADLCWGVIPIFQSDFTAISFNMYNVYLNIGFAYVF